MNDLSSEIGKTLCHTWGLNPNEVLSIVIHIHPWENPHAVVELRLNEGVITELVNLTRHHA